MSQPANLPHDWEYQPETNSVICGGCAFRYGAEYPDGDGNWTCPNCGAGNGSLEQHRVGEYVADYTPLTEAEMNTPNPELDELMRNSRPVPEQSEREG